MTYRITSRFLEQEPFRTRPHTGIDFAMPENTPLRSIKDGIVERVVDFGSSNIGKGVFIKWQDGKTAIYGHLSQITVKQGDIVQAGDLIGYSGNTGHSTGAHLHFAVKEGGRFIDPSPYIDFIQNMNNPSFLAKMQHASDTVTLNGTQFIQMISDTLSSIKFQFIHIFVGEVNYYTLLLQIMKKSFQFLACHTSFLYDILWSIF
ncbi:Glycyl-glycine endopeptidase lytM precursor [[Flavobacterium] thermophilum]|nr:Glycyl-glycine endopeptidase lytM precursor [[Flavobacterium] thermophilum]